MVKLMKIDRWKVDEIPSGKPTKTRTETSKAPIWLIAPKLFRTLSPIGCCASVSNNYGPDWLGFAEVIPEILLFRILIQYRLIGCL